MLFYNSKFSSILNTHIATLRSSCLISLEHVLYIFQINIVVFINEVADKLFFYLLFLHINVVIEPLFFNINSFDISFYWILIALNIVTQSHSRSRAIIRLLTLDPLMMTASGAIESLTSYSTDLFFFQFLLFELLFKGFIDLLLHLESKCKGLIDEIRQLYCKIMLAFGIISRVELLDLLFNFLH